MTLNGPRLPIGAVGFDFDHTLGIDNKLERVVFLRLLTEVCSQDGRCLGTLAEEIERIDGLLEKQRSGSCAIEEAVESFVRDRGGHDPQRYPKRYKRMAVDMAGRFVIPEPGLRHMLDSLRERRIPFAILTNGWSPLQQRKAEIVGFDGRVIVSSDIGSQKPQPAAFEALSNALGMSADKIAYVGDNPASDVAGALRAGMHAIWFDAEGLTYPKELPAPTAVIHSLAELLTLL